MNYLKLLIIIFIISCNTRDIVETEDSFLVLHSDKPAEQLFEDLKAEIEANGLEIFSVIEHSKAAENVGLELRSNTLILFGNPKVGTQLMQCDPRMGIELPLKLLVWKGTDDRTHVGFWRMGDYEEYYELHACEEILSNINDTVKEIINVALQN